MNIIIMTIKSSSGQRKLGSKQTGDHHAESTYLKNRKDNQKILIMSSNLTFQHYPPTTVYIKWHDTVNKT